MVRSTTGETALMNDLAGLVQLREFGLSFVQGRIIERL
jgi:hypothetical protein